MNTDLIKLRQDADSNPTMEFRDGQCLFRTNTTAGTAIERFISWEAVREAALGIPIDSGWIGMEIVRWGTGRPGEWCVAFIPPGRHVLELTSGTPGPDEKVDKIEAPLPGLAMFGAALNYFVWSVKTPILNPHHEVCRCPLPNVLADAKICWGLLEPPQASPKTMLKAFEMFIHSTFNNHAASGKSKSQRDDVRVLLRALAGGPCPDVDPDCAEAPMHNHSDAAAYPVGDLVRQVEGTGVTLDTAVREFFKTGEMPG